MQENKELDASWGGYFYFTTLASVVVVVDQHRCDGAIVVKEDNCGSPHRSVLGSHCERVAKNFIRAAIGSDIRIVADDGTGLRTGGCTGR